MSILPYEEPQHDAVVVQRTDLKPIKPGPPGRWERFINAVRTIWGGQPLELVRRFAEATVREKEIDNEVKLLQARLEYEKTMAHVRAMDGQTKGKLTNDQADANVKRSQAREISDRTRQRAERLTQTHTPEGAADHVREIIQRIENAGGRVEVDLPNQPEVED